MTQLQQIKQWILDSGQSPSSGLVKLYIGLCAEEMAEMLGSQTMYCAQLNQAADGWKAGHFGAKRNPDLIDAACDLIWVATGVLVAMGIDPDEAMQRVIDSNESKRQEDGTFLKDANGKIMKPAGYKPPNWGGLL